MRPTVEAARVEFLGKKSGRIKSLQDLLGKATPEQRPVLGAKFNEVRQRVTAALEARQTGTCKAESLSLTAIDISLARRTDSNLGRRHPLTQTMDEFRDIIGRMGFTVAEGPELEDEWHNFEALNIPLDHPARDPLDNFYLAAAKTAAGGPVLLRSQTSTVQIRVMEKSKPPIRIVSLGRVYRPDTIDATHCCMFHQMEGLMVGEDVTMAQLKTTLRSVCDDLPWTRRDNPLPTELLPVHRTVR